MNPLSRFLSPHGILPVALWVCLSLFPHPVVAEEGEVTAEVAKLVARDGQPTDTFGYSVSLDGDYLAIGAYKNDDNGLDSGSVYVFERNMDGDWIAASRLLAPDGEAGDFFGFSVSLDGDRLAVGASEHKDNGPFSGAVYLFERDAGGDWLVASDLLAPDGQAGDQFGWQVSLDGDRLAIGAIGDDDNGPFSGSAYLFERDMGGAWFAVSKLVPSDGQVGDSFGTSVSLQGDRVAVGASADDVNGLSSGSAYVFERDPAGSWLEASKLVPLDGQALDSFGASLSLDGDSVAIGARLDDDNGPDSGSIYVFERDLIGGWLEADKVLPTTGVASALFGSSLSLDGDRLVVGAHLGDENGSDSGSVYTFEQSADGKWYEADKPLPLDAQESDFFGISVSLDGDRMAIGASGSDDNGEDSGAAYMFETVLVSPQLTLSGTCPGEVQFTLSGTTPRSGFGLYSSATPGTWTLDSGPCEGVSLDLDTPTLLGEGNTDFDGENSRVRNVDGPRCGTYLQLIDLNTCLTSDIAQIP